MGNDERDDAHDPEPDRTPGLDPGGSVPPGETPPESASATEGLSIRGPRPSGAARWWWLGAVLVVVVLVALFFAFSAWQLL